MRPPQRAVVTMESAYGGILDACPAREQYLHPRVFLTSQRHDSRLSFARLNIP
jgi:hypothetical protein